jgi:ribosomal protein L16/L10AE
VDSHLSRQAGVTMKAAETRMGSGKGNVDHYVAVVKPGASSLSWWRR